MTRLGTGEIRRVYDSYASGSRTTFEVAADTGIAQNKACAYTAALIQRGWLKKTGTAPVDPGTRGIRPGWYEPISTGLPKTPEDLQAAEFTRAPERAKNIPC